MSPTKVTGPRSTRVPSSPTSAPKTVKAREGETLKSIAERELGDPARWRELQDANKDVLGRSLQLKPGMTLKMPARATAAGVTADVPPAVPTPSKSTIKSAETRLKRAGFNPGRVDGKLDAKATTAVKQFQESVGLEGTGLLDKKTLDKLKSVDARVKKYRGKLLGKGQAGKNVRDVERRLKRLGYDPGKVDGIYDATTESAVRAFRADQKELKKGDARVLGTRGQEVLKNESAAFGHAPERRRVKPSTERKKLDASTAREAAATDETTGLKGIGRGDKGAAVKYVQEHLRAAGFDPKHVNGKFDERTEGALKQWQRQSGLPDTGRVDAQTWRKLREATMEARTSTSPAQSVGERSGAVKRTEKMLHEMGFKTGKVDGLYTAQTQKALDAFRKKQHLKGRGDGVGPNTLKRLTKEWKDSRGITANQLRRCMPGLSSSRARAYVGPLNKAMREFGITNEKRREAFLAQLGHESVSLNFFEEIWGPTPAQLGYEGRADLGNTHRGDGFRYKGRGPIQLTGRANYRTAGRALGLPLEKKPWLAARPSVGFRIAGWFWKTHGLNGLADRSAFRDITQRINGGFNGLADRLQRWAITRRVIK